MVNITVPFPDDLRTLAENAARERGMPLEEFVRMCVTSSLPATRQADPLFANLETYRGDAPSDVSARHDDYLYGEKP